MIWLENTVKQSLWHLNAGGGNSVASQIFRNCQEQSYSLNVEIRDIISQLQYHDISDCSKCLVLFVQPRCEQLNASIQFYEKVESSYSLSYSKQYWVAIINMKLFVVSQWKNVYTAMLKHVSNIYLWITFITKGGSSDTWLLNLCHNQIILFLLIFILYSTFTPGRAEGKLQGRKHSFLVYVG